MVLDLHSHLTLSYTDFVSLKIMFGPLVLVKGGVSESGTICDTAAAAEGGKQDKTLF